jgi:hypothetical protein
VSSAGGIRRPGIVTFIGVIVYVQAALCAVAALAAVAFRNAPPVLEATGQTTAALLWTGIGEATLAVILFAVAAGIMSGSSGARLLVTFAVAVRMVLAVWLILSHQRGGFLTVGLFHLLVGVLVLWALYAESDTYFDSP